MIAGVASQVLVVGAWVEGLLEGWVVHSQCSDDQGCELVLGAGFAGVAGWGLVVGGVAGMLLVVWTWCSGF